MSTKQPSQLLYDSEATLRLVDTAIREMGELAHDDVMPLEERVPSADAAGTGTALGLLGLSDLLAKGYAEILGVLDSLRQSRHLLERAAVEKIQHTHDKLREVTNATETAATDILNGLDRANTMLDELDAYAGEHGEPDGRGAATRSALRDELFALMGHMQFQDITSQQLSYASAVLTEMEARLTNIARAFDPTVFGRPHLDEATFPAAGGLVTYDPNASTRNREERQAIADAIIARQAGA